MAEFTDPVEFKVDEVQYPMDNYMNFIRDVRDRLRDRSGGRDRYSHNRPVLPPQENPPNRWFEIILRTESNAIRLRIRCDNLYLDGYRIENSNQWFEFGSDTTNPPSRRLIPGSRFLGYDGNYNSLEGAAGSTREDTSLGRQQLIASVDQLATSQERAKPLIVIIQMICESIRFQSITEEMAATFRLRAVEEVPPAWMLAQENRWGYLSDGLLHLDADPTYRFRPPQSTDILTAEQAAIALGILLGSTTYCASSTSRRFPRMAGVEEGQCPQGRPLVEVFSVCIDNIDGENPGDLYGTITVIDGLGSQYIYNRERGNSESICPGDTALLTGPAHSISAYDSFTIKVALMDEDFDLSPDDEVSNGQISWNVFNTTNKYDMPLSDKVDGKNGSATVNYIVLSNAVEATVEVILIDGDGEDPADVYGRITAKKSEVTNPMNESVLFRKASEENVEVSPGQPIPLSRSVVAVPLNSSLIVWAELWDHDTFSPDDEIAKGSAEFRVHSSGVSEEEISGEYGKIRVKVTWT